MPKKIKKLAIKCFVQDTTQVIEGTYSFVYSLELVKAAFLEFLEVKDHIHI